MYEHRLAYRHDNGEVEGFVGIGFSGPSAETNALDQIRRKVDLINDMRSKPPRACYDPSRVINAGGAGGLSSEELATIKADWESNFHY